MKGKTPVLVLSQHSPQPSTTQPFRNNNTNNNNNNNNTFSRSNSTPNFNRRSSHFNTPPQQQHQQQQQQQTQQPTQQRTLLMRKPSGNVGQKHQYYHHQQYDHHNNFDRNFRQPDYPQQQQGHYNFKECQYSHSNTHHTQRHTPRPTSTQSLNSPRSETTPSIPSQASSTSATSTPSFVVSTDSSSSPSSSSSMPASSSISSVPNVTLAAVVGSVEAHNSDPEPALGDVEQYLENQHQLLQSNRLSKEARSHKAAAPRSSARSQLPTKLGLRLSPPGAAAESDMSSNSSLRESSDYDTLETEDDDKGILGSDSNDTDSVLGDAMALDKRSRRKRSMQRLIAKNKTLKSSLQQAKADLAAERHNRAMIDQIYLKIKKELNSKLEAEECKVANLRAELEQMTHDVQELKEKSTSYKIGYDSSAYSLSSGLGGLMLHHSNIPDCDEDEEEDETFIKAEKSSRTKEDSSPSCGWQDRLHTQEEKTVAGEVRAIDTNHGAVSEQGDDSEKKVSFLATPIDTPARARSPLPIAAESDNEEQGDDEYEGDDSDDSDGEDAPCTMMELLIKKEQSQSSEDDTQDAAADADETFDSMTEKFLHQAIRAKLTAARTILQLDDLLLKYDAIPEELIMILTHELTKWWEKERVEAGGPATGGWGTGSVLLPETGDRVTAKVAVETKFKSVYVPLLLNYVASHKEQLMLLEKLERYAKANDKSMRNHTAQLMALYKFDILDADAILEWWRLLKEPQGVFGHGNGLRSMSSKFVAWLEDEEDDSDDDSDDDDDSDEESDSEDEHEEELDEAIDANGQGKIVGLDLLAREELLSPRNLFQSLDDDLAQADAEKERMMVILSDDGMDDQMSTSSSLERIEECERKRRISFCTNNVYIHQNGRVRVNKAPVSDEQRRKMEQCPPFEAPVDDEEEEEEDEEEEDSDDE
ncbi:hypothetical protein BGX30_010646 [Mortierella sp. GBA39]|nr:hypothetical protein BGX30_010646 [Mortierella sp. GBA39]